MGIKYTSYNREIRSTELLTVGTLSQEASAEQSAGRNAVPAPTPWSSFSMHSSFWTQLNLLFRLICQVHLVSLRSSRFYKSPAILCLQLAERASGVEYLCVLSLFGNGFLKYKNSTESPKGTSTFLKCFAPWFITRFWHPGIEIRVDSINTLDII